MNRQVHEFFLTYEKANSSSEPAAICNLYADSFMFAGPTGVQAIRREDFIRIVPKMKMHFSSMGISRTDLQTVEARALDSKYLLADVVWRVTLGNPHGSQHVDASATYVLARGEEDSLSIVFQIDHQDLASTIQSHQDTQP